MQFSSINILKTELSDILSVSQTAKNAMAERLHNFSCHCFYTGKWVSKPILDKKNKFLQPQYMNLHFSALSPLSASSKSNP